MFEGHLQGPRGEDSGHLDAVVQEMGLQGRLLASKAAQELLVLGKWDGITQQVPRANGPAPSRYQKPQN